MQMRESTTTEARPWRDVLREQGRSLVWLAGATGISRRMVYDYSRGLRPPDGWLERVSAALGESVR